MGKKKISTGVWLLGLLIVFCSYTGVAGAKNRSKTKTVTKSVPLGDPFILLHDGTYYAYGTHAADGIEVYTSKDLRKWKLHGLALHKDDVWADSRFWAPEIYEIDGKFYMYYTADEHICVAIADSPLGPFRQNEKKPMVAGEKMIDSSLFIDEDGKPYLFFVRFNDGNNVWVAELEDDYMTIKTETMRPCIHVSQAWEEVWPRVNEGSYVLKHNGLYYMTYSGNSFESPFYGIGCATATDIMGNGPNTRKIRFCRNRGICREWGIVPCSRIKRADFALFIMRIKIKSIFIHGACTSVRSILKKWMV